MINIKNAIIKGIKEKGVERIELSKKVCYYGYDKYGNQVDYTITTEGIKDELGEILWDIRVETGEEFFAMVELARSELIKGEN